MFFFGYLLHKIASRKKLESAENMAARIIDDAKREAENRKKEVKLEAKDELLKARVEFEKETKIRRQELMQLERRLAQKEENLDKKVEFFDKRESKVAEQERNINEKEKQVTVKNNELAEIVEKQKGMLQKISGLTADQAKEFLLKRMKDEVSHEAESMIRKITEEAKDAADKKAKNLITYAIQRCAADQVVESSVSVVHLPNDEMKGRIIGREGRNIRALEAATGVDVIIDDTPEAVILSGFDPVRRQIAKMTLEKLIVDGRIHPTRIEELVEKSQKEMQDTIKEVGEQVAFDTGVHGLHPEIIKLLGRLKFRTSYGQNVLQHSKEVAHLMGVMASELKFDVQLAKRIGLLHDLGKATDHEVEGSHAVIGADLAKKYGESDLVVNAIGAHHSDCEPKSLLAILVQAADAISATRPGARRETLDIYVKRLEKLEEIAGSFKGVEKSYAIQAGREIRVMVEPFNVDDANSIVLARDIAKKIEEEMEYPGQIKVAVIRETRFVEYAK
ncbi:ribonuclease Y [bacterium]|nr:ribonuclease Y [bacterium]